MSRSAVLVQSLALAAGLALAQASGAHAQREMSTDRPDMTESAVPVERGRIQVELDVMNATLSQQSESRVLSFAPAANIKLGVDTRVDLQLVVAALAVTHVRTRGVAISSRLSAGPGEIGGRIKVNLLGAEGDGPALALMPFAVGPLGEVTEATPVEVGAVVPWSIPGPEGFDFGGQIQALWGIASTHIAELSGTLEVGRTLVGPLSAFLELAVIGALAPSPSASVELHGGMVFELTADLRVDWGVFGTVWGAGAGDLYGFVGMSARTPALWR